MTTRDRRRSYRPGGWFGIFGDHASVLLPPTEKHRVSALWELVDDGAGFDEVLDGLLASGLRDLPGFVLVSETEHGTKVVLRGPAVAAFVTEGEMVELAGASDTTWVERSLTGVTQMFIQVEPTDEEEGEDLVITSGLVRLARVDEPPFAPAAVDAVAQEPAGDAEEVPAEAEEVPAEEEEPPAEESPAAVEDVEAASPWEVPAQQVASSPEAPVAGEAAAAFGVAAPAYPPPVTAEPAFAEPEATEPEPVAEPAGPAPPSSEGGRSDHDGLTSGGWEGDEVLRPQSGVSTASTREPVPSVARLLFSTGEVVEVDRPILIGRAPEVRRFAAHDRPRLVRVPSPHQEISSTHLEVRPGAGVDHGAAVVTDLGSTNGTVLLQPNLPPEDLQPGIAVQLVPGAIIDLGEGVTIQVTQPEVPPAVSEPWGGTDGP